MRASLAALPLLLSAGLASSACGGGSIGPVGGGDAAGVVVVNAPAAGEVRRVVAREGMVVNAGAPLFEIAVRDESQKGAAPQPKAEDPFARAARNVEAAQSEIEAARGAVVRAEVEVSRLAPLVAAGEAPQGQLDGARADYERAQQRLRAAQSGAHSAQAGLVTARQQQQQQHSFPPAPAERLVSASASSGGTVTALSVREGDRVRAGQPLATLRAEPR